MKYSLYITLIALAALGVRAEQQYCDGAEKNPTGAQMTDPFAVYQSPRFDFPKRCKPPMAKSRPVLRERS
jgi:hypothetical protein